MASVVECLDLVTSILNNASYLTDPHPTRTSNWWHDTPPDPKTTHPRGFVHVINHRVEKISLGRKYCSRHILFIGLRLFTKGEGKLATAITENSIVYKSDRFLMLYLDKVDDALANAQDDLVNGGYKNYHALGMTDPIPWEPTQGWTAELQIQLQFYRSMGNG